MTSIMMFRALAVCHCISRAFRCCVQQWSVQFRSHQSFELCSL